MSLFDYGECSMCKRRRCNKKLALCNVLPANVCNIIGDYVNDCWRCEKLKENEKHSFQGFTGVNDDVNRASNQLKCFIMFKMSFVFDINVNERHSEYKKEIDRIFDKQNVKEKYIYKKGALQALKSFCKGYFEDIVDAVKNCYKPEEFEELFYDSDNEWFSTGTFMYRKREYGVKDLIKEFLVEYIDDLIGTDKKYCDIKKIREHINKLFER